jgi:hypothetical protein
MRLEHQVEAPALVTFGPGEHLSVAHRRGTTMAIDAHAKYPGDAFPLSPWCWDPESRREGGTFGFEL